MTDENRQTWIVDSTEEGVAAVEVDGKDVIHVPLSVLPARVKEGDVFSVRHTKSDSSAVIVIERDDAMREKLLERSRKQAALQVGKDKGGSIRL